jgi:hypothetical protein
MVNKQYHATDGGHPLGGGGGDFFQKVPKFLTDQAMKIVLVVFFYLSPNITMQ